MLPPSRCLIEAPGSSTTRHPFLCISRAIFVSSKYKKYLSSNPPTSSNALRRNSIQHPEIQSTSLRPASSGPKYRRVAGFCGQTPPSTPCAIPTNSDGNRRPDGYTLPLRSVISGPIIPITSEVLADSTSLATDPAPKVVSGLTTSSHSASVSSAAWLIARDRPTLLRFRTTRPPKASTRVGPSSAEALSTQTTSKGSSPIAGPSDSSNPGRSSAL